MNEHDEFLPTPLIIFNHVTGLYDLFTETGKRIEFEEDPRKVISKPIIRIEEKGENIS